MTDQIDQNLDDTVEETDEQGGTRNRRRMFITGAGIAGAAAIVGSKSASAADGDNVVAGQDTTATTRTSVTNGGTNAGTPGTPGNEALYGEITEAGNGSHAVRGITAGTGHGVAGEIDRADNTVGATWGRHRGLGAGISGINANTNDVPIAGTARGVEGIITESTNGSHAVYGETPGGGHSVAGDTPADAAGLNGEGVNTVAATWGRHGGIGAGVGGVNTATGVDIAGTARGVEGFVADASNGSHAVYGETAGGGHSVAGDTPADAAGPGGEGRNTTAATWGRHGGIGAGIGGVSAEGYGGEFIGGKAHVRLIQTSDAPSGPPSGEDHELGELYADGAGDLFYNTAEGSNWVPLTQGGRGGSVFFDDPQRAYDSRQGKNPASANKTRFSAGETREIDLTEFTDFPASATAAIVNLTVVSPEGFRGYATVFNGDTEDDSRPDTSNINWQESTEVIANSATVRANSSGVVKVYASEATDFIIDIQGYIA